MSKDSIPFKYPSSCTLVPIDKIDLSGRRRSEFGDVQDLADSIMEVGLVHPPVIRKKDRKLIGGERRIRAFQLLKCDIIPIMYREDMSDAQLKELEFRENFDRKEMTWQENVLLIYDIHELRVHENLQIGKRWYQKQTSSIFKQSEAHVHNALVLARQILDGDTEVINSKTISEALDIMLKRAHKETTAERVRRFGQVQPIVARPSTASGITFFDPDDPNAQLPSSAISDSATSLTPSQVQNLISPQGTSPKQKTQFDLGAMFQLGDSMELLCKYPPLSVDHVVTDIPYGIDMDNLDMGMNLKDTIDQHEVTQNKEMIPTFIEQSFRIIRNGYCTFWMDINDFAWISELAAKIGFKVQKWPLYWIKTHPCQNRNAQFNYTKSVETAIILRKGEQTTLVKPASRNYVIADGSIEKKLYGNHAFLKPSEVWKFQLEYIAITGSTILDPFAGQFSSIRTMINMGMNPRGIELVPYHFAQGVMMVMSQLQTLTNDGAEFINNPLANIDPATITA